MTAEGEAFRRHPAARLFGPGGGAAGPDAAPRPTGPDRPAAPALAGAMAAAAAGLPFRIGGRGGAPRPGRVPVFETLTGGTTGAPRRVRRSHASWIASFRVDARRFGIGPGVAVAVPGRLVHSLPLYGAIGALHLGADLHLLDGLRPDRQRAALAARGTAVLWATPAHLALILAGGGPGLPGLRHVLLGGGAPARALRDRLAALAPGARVTVFYGAAETSFIAMTEDGAPEGSVGRPYPGVALALDADGGIRVRGPYLADSAARDAEGWVRPGDRGRLRDGWLFLDGRADRMVRVADQPVWPDAVEAVLLAQPGVTGAAVVPRPDPARGHVLEAVLTGDPAAEQAVMAALRAAFGPLAAPRRLHWRAALPLTPAGKVDLAALADP